MDIQIEVNTNICLNYFLYFDSRQDGGGGNVTIKAGEAGDLGAGGHFHVGGRSPTVKQSKSVTFKDC